MLEPIVEPIWKDRLVTAAVLSTQIIMIGTDALGRSNRYIELHPKPQPCFARYAGGYGTTRLWGLANVASLESARSRRSVARKLQPFGFARSKWNHPRIFSHLLVRAASKDPADFVSLCVAEKEQGRASTLESRPEQSHRFLHEVRGPVKY